MVLESGIIVIPKGKERTKEGFCMARLSREQMCSKLCAWVREIFVEKELADEAVKYIFSIYNKKKTRKKDDGSTEEYLPSYAQLEKMVKEKYSEKFDAIALAKELAKNKKKEEKRKKAAEEANKPTAE